MNEFKFTEPSIEELAAPFVNNRLSPTEEYRASVIWSNEQ
jgi:hypothetical protein